jgi:hypothetical protein
VDKDVSTPRHRHRNYGPTASDLGSTDATGRASHHGHRPCVHRGTRVLPGVTTVSRDIHFPAAGVIRSSAPQQISHTCTHWIYIRMYVCMFVCVYVVDVLLCILSENTRATMRDPAGRVPAH